jgi:WD40 repeat protein
MIRAQRWLTLLLSSASLVLMPRGDAEAAQAEGSARPVLLDHEGGVDWLRFLADGKTLVTKTKVGGVLTFWETATWKPRARIRLSDLGGQVDSSMDLSADGRVLAISGSDKHTIKVWDLTDKSPMGTVVSEAEMFFPPVLSPDGATVATAHGKFDRPAREEDRGRVILWNTSTGRETHSLVVGGTGFVFPPVFSPDGKMVATGHFFGEPRLVLWDVVTGERKQERQTDYFVIPLAFSPDGKQILLGNVDGTSFLHHGLVQVRDLNDFKEVWSYSGNPRADLPTLLGVFSGGFNDGQILPDGKTVVSYGNAWDLQTGERKSVAEDLVEKGRNWAISPDGQWLAVCRDESPMVEVKRLQ